MGDNYNRRSVMYMHTRREKNGVAGMSAQSNGRTIVCVCAEWEVIAIEKPVTILCAVG